MKSDTKSKKVNRNSRGKEKKDKSKKNDKTNTKNSSLKKNTKSSGNIKIKIRNNREREGKEKESKQNGGKDMQERRREERRKEKRIPVEVEVRYSSQEGFAIEWITNISKGGLFIKSEKPLPPGTPLKITFSIPGKDVPVEVGGVVRWSVPPSSSPSVIPGMGIQITEIDEKSKKILDAFVDEILSSRRI
jgi:uncharacterized protein (TIGR02266 family)